MRLAGLMAGLNENDRKQFLNLLDKVEGGIHWLRDEEPCGKTGSGSGDQKTAKQRKGKGRNG
jgi:hypothetical protein